MAMQIKKRGRPSKSSTPTEQINRISKPQVQSAPVSNHQEQENGDESTKKKRGRPSSVSPKKAAVPATPSASKETSSTRKRGRPSGSGVKKSASKPKASASNDGSARKRGRPKKAAASPTVVATTTPVNETTATVIPNNVQ